MEGGYSTPAATKWRVHARRATGNPPRPLGMRRDSAGHALTRRAAACGRVKARQPGQGRWGGRAGRVIAREPDRASARGKQPPPQREGKRGLLGGMARFWGGYCEVEGLVLRGFGLVVAWSCGWYCVVLGLVLRGCWDGDCVGRWNFLAVVDFVISTPVILYGGYNYNVSRVYT